MNMHARYMYFCGLLLFLSGCAGNRYMRWGTDVFFQSKRVENYRWLQDKYVRTVRVYDQLTTLALFDALWLSPEVRALYEQDISSCECKDGKQIDSKNQTAFYLLAALPHSDDALLTDITSPWRVYAEIDGKCYEPALIKIVDLPYPYEVFFGKYYYSTARKIYYITFAARPVHSLSLCYHSTGRIDECVTWDVCGDESLPEHKYNPDLLAVDIQREGGQI